MHNMSESANGTRPCKYQLARCLLSNSSKAHTKPTLNDARQLLPLPLPQTSTCETFEAALH